jgi:O-antigen/teichoic acid export membrane protein
LVVSSVSLKRALPPVYAAAAVRLLFPLLVLPVMAVRLGTDEFGRLGLMLVWAGLLAILVEGGFLGAATRRAVVADAAERLRLARQVFSARCVLCLPVVLLALGVSWWEARSVADGVQSAGPQLADTVLLAALACAMGWPATWYLQATSQLHRWAWVELTVQGLLLVLTLLLAHSVEVYLLLQVASAASLAALGWRWLWRDLRGESASGLWARGEVGSGLRLGAAMLPVSLAGAAYSLALPAIASTRMARSELGLYYLADRVVRALLGATDPLMQLIYPRIVDRFRGGARAALRYAGRWAVGGLLAGLSVLAVLLLGWPLLGQLIGGAEPARLFAVFAVSGCLLPLLMSWKFIGFWMLGSGRFDHAYRACIVVGAVCGVTGAWVAGHTAVALAGVALVAETAVILAAITGIVITLRSERG